MARVAVSTADVVAPVFAAAEVVVLFTTGVTAQTRLGNLLRGLVLEGNDFLRIALLDVGLAWTMARFASSHLLFPTREFCKLSMRSVREIFELIFVAVFTNLTADVVISLEQGKFGRTDLRRLRGRVIAEPAEGS